MAVDLNAERRKLSSLRQKERELRRESLELPDGDITVLSPLKTKSRSKKKKKKKKGKR